SAEVAHHLARGRPVIALVESGRRQNHYVVLVGWGAGGVLLHDPAAGPWRVWSEAELQRRWAPTGLLALLVLPPPPADPEVPSPRPDRSVNPSSSASCDPLVDASVRRALAGDLDDAAARLQAATALCPGSARAWRERAGVSFRAEDHAAAAA